MVCQPIKEEVLVGQRLTSFTVLKKASISQYIKRLEKLKQGNNLLLRSEVRRRNGYISKTHFLDQKCNGKFLLYIYNRYHTITDVYTTALLLTKPSSFDDSGFRHGFGTEVSLPLTQRAPAVSHDSTRFCQIVVALWGCQIHAYPVRALTWIYSMYFHLSDGGSPRIVKKTEVELAIKPLHPTSVGNTFVIQPFLTYCSRRSSFLSNLCWCAQFEIFFHKGQLTQ